MLSDIIDVKCGGADCKWNGTNAIIETRNGEQIEILTAGGFEDSLENLREILVIAGANIEGVNISEGATPPNPQPQPSQIPSNCNNCSAIIPKGENTCEYCGTTYN